MIGRTSYWLLALIAVGCSEPPEPPEPSERTWYISRFGGAEQKWRRDTRPRQPQKKPAMLIFEVTQFPNADATPEQLAAAADLRSKSLLAAVQHGWYDFDVARMAGYELMFSDDVHYVNEEFVFDDAVLDPQRPEFLMYYDTAFGKSLVGFMFYVGRSRDRGEQVGGPLTTWHFHVWSRPQCLVKGLLAVAAPSRSGECKPGRGVPMSRSPEMLHVWLLDHPEGPFATRMRIRPDVLARLVDERGF